MTLYNIKELLTLPPKILAAISIATGLILFLPTEVINKLYLEEFKRIYGFVLGITFTISTSILLCTLVVFVCKVLFFRWYHKNEKVQYIRNLTSLNNYEKNIIAALYDAPDNTIELPINKGITRKLEHLNIIGKTTSVSLVFGYDSSDWRFPYLLQPWVIEYINANPDYLRNIS